jgi:hypothetical protein
MKAILEFNLPEDRERYEYCYNGEEFLDAIKEIIEFFRWKEDVDAKAMGWEEMKLTIFKICESHGFSPWED